MTTIYTRTEKGNQEIKKRTYKLNHVQRFILLMVDGKICANEIISSSLEHWKPVQCLFELEQQGFIENTDPDASKAANISPLKQNLIEIIDKYLPEDNQKLVNRILNAEMKRKSICDAIDSNSIYVKVTQSSHIAHKLKTISYKIVGESSEV